MQTRWDDVSDVQKCSKHVLFGLGVEPTARDAGEGRGSDPQVSQATPYALVAVHVPPASQVLYRQASQDVKQML